jgi:hypothetical protein
MRSWSITFEETRLRTSMLSLKGGKESPSSPAEGASDHERRRMLSRPHAVSFPPVPHLDEQM